MLDPEEAAAMNTGDLIKAMESNDATKSTDYASACALEAEMDAIRGELDRRDEIAEPVFNHWQPDVSEREA